MQVLWFLSREAREQMVQRSEAGVDKRGVLGGRGLAQALEDRRDARVGYIVLLDAGLDTSDVLHLGIDGGLFLQDGEQALNLFIGEFFGHDPLESRIWQRVRAGTMRSCLVDDEGWRYGVGVGRMRRFGGRTCVLAESQEQSGGGRDAAVKQNSDFFGRCMAIC